MRVEISIKQQVLTLYDDEGGVKEQYSVSTAANGAGCERDSGCTPLGSHIVRAKIGAGMLPNTVFVGRRATKTSCPRLFSSRHRSTRCRSPPPKVLADETCSIRIPHSV